MSNEKKNLAQFINKLSADPKLQKALKSDPDGTMKAHGVMGKEAEIVRSRDLNRLQAHLGDYGAAGQVHIVW